MAKRILFLDDKDERHDYCNRNFKTLTIAHAYTVDQAKEIAASQDKFDIFSLDHDLGTTDNGHDFVMFMSTLPKEKLPDVVVIHSVNEPAAQRMKTTLKELVGLDALLVPFRV